jgi:CBS-domain-containing membrane protein
MNGTHKPLLALTAADLMSQALVMIPQDMSLEGAARLLSQAHVTGAPVIDAEGRCAGVLSATDFVHWAEAGSRPKAADEQAAWSCSWQIFEPDTLPQDAVRHYMTADPVTVTVSSRIGELAQMMLDARIHRVIVVDANQRPIGIVSSTDLLAALAQAALAAKGHARSIEPAVPAR